MMLLRNSTRRKLRRPSNAGRFPTLSLFLSLLLSAASALAHTYYVSSSHGADSSAGTEHAPWKTIAKVNAQLLKPGDVVAFRRGDTWRETLRPRSSGKRGLPITFRAYGSGQRPTLRGSITAGEDVNIDNNERSYIVYRELNLEKARQGLRLYAWRGVLRGITLEASTISTEPTRPHGTMSAGVYANVSSGEISEIVIRQNTFRPHPDGLEHWGVYFVKGVTDFRVEENSFGPAGEDAICVWHSASGVIRGNRGGGNGENTVDVKDSRDILVLENIADSDAEYNIVVHTVDRNDAAHDITLRRNQCRRGGLGGRLTAGIALLSVERTRVLENVIEDPRGTGIYVRDGIASSGNEVLHNTVRGNTSRNPAISLEQAPGTRVSENNSLP
jgi:parallel beta-helix repeat protein